jgi:hypothetical protein
MFNIRITISIIGIACGACGMEKSSDSGNPQEIGVGLRVAWPKSRKRETKQ